MAKVTLTLEARIAKLEKSLTTTEKKMKDLGKQSNKTQKQMQKNFDTSAQKADKLGDSIKGALTIGAAAVLARHIFNVRKEFEKYETVLRAALGSQEAATKQFKELRGLASTLPFSVAELTDSFIKLNNQGFKPTMEQMRNLADVAAVMGKSFDQLTEAIIDAQVGEFERLKEFGIRASKEGDKVTFAFRGVETQVAFTADAIRGYILSLGDLNGIQGATEELAKTLTGQLSMLQDATDALSDALGGLAEEELKEGIDTLTDLSNIIATLIRIVDGFEDERFEKIRTRITGLVGAMAAPQLQQAWRGAQLFKLGLDEAADGLIELEKTLEEADIEDRTGLIADFFDVDSSTFEGIDNLIERTQALLGEVNRFADIRETGVEEDDGEEQRLARKQAIEIAIAELEKQMAAEEQSRDEERLARKQAIEEQIVALKTEMAEKAAQAEVEAEKKAEQEKQAIREKAFQTAHTLLNELSALNQQNLQIELEKAGENAKEREKITREFARKEQKISIGRALISGAEAMLKIAATYAPPISTILQVLQAVQTAAQVAVISSQKFARGGYEVLSGARHAQGGVRIPIGEAEGGEGHAVFSRKATQKYKNLIPGLVADINAGKVVATDDIKNGMVNVNLDDSDQLEEIRRLLARKEKTVTYENGYRIEKFNNVVRRVKV